MSDSTERHVGQFGGDVVVAQRPPLAVGAHEVLGLLYGVGEADVLEGKHVVHAPPLRYLRGACLIISFLEALFPEVFTHTSSQSSNDVCGTGH